MIPPGAWMGLMVGLRMGLGAGLCSAVFSTLWLVLRAPAEAVRLAGVVGAGVGAVIVWTFWRDADGGPGRGHGER